MIQCLSKIKDKYNKQIAYRHVNHCSFSKKRIPSANGQIKLFEQSSIYYISSYGLVCFSFRIPSYYPRAQNPRRWYGGVIFLRVQWRILELLHIPSLRLGHYVDLHLSCNICIGDHSQRHVMTSLECQLAKSSKLCTISPNRFYYGLVDYIFEFQVELGFSSNQLIHQTDFVTYLHGFLRDVTVPV